MLGNTFDERIRTHGASEKEALQVIAICLGIWSDLVDMYEIIEVHLGPLLVRSPDVGWGDGGHNIWINEVNVLAIGLVLDIFEWNFNTWGNNMLGFLERKSFDQELHVAWIWFA